MFCTKCGNEIKEQHRFCIKCGNPAPIPQKTSTPIAKVATEAEVKNQSDRYSPRPTTAIYTRPERNPSIQSPHVYTETMPEYGYTNYIPNTVYAPIPGINENANKTRKALTLIQIGMLVLQTIFIFCKIIKIKVSMFGGMIDSDTLAEITGDYFDGKTSFSLFDLFMEFAKPSSAGTVAIIWLILTIALLLFAILFISLTLLSPKLTEKKCKIRFCNLALISTMVGDILYGFTTALFIFAMSETADSINRVTSYLAGTTVSASPTFFGILAIILCIASIVFSIILRVFASKSTHK